MPHHGFMFRATQGIKKLLVKYNQKYDAEVHAALSGGHSLKQGNCINVTAINVTERLRHQTWFTRSVLALNEACTRSFCLPQSEKAVHTPGSSFLFQHIISARRNYCREDSVASRFKLSP